MQNVVDRPFPKRTYVFTPQAYELNNFFDSKFYSIFIALFFSEIFFYFSSLTFLHPVLVGIDNWQLTMWKICEKNYVRISIQITKNGYKTNNWFNFDSAWKFQTVEKCSNGRRIDKDLIFPTRIFIKFIFNILI